MCESTVFIEEKNSRTEFMKDVAKIEVTDDGIICYDIIGESRKAIGVKFKLLNLMDHSIILEK
jgi:predicted RNA-binding protein